MKHPSRGISLGCIAALLVTACSDPAAGLSAREQPPAAEPQLAGELRTGRPAISRPTQAPSCATLASGPFDRTAGVSGPRLDQIAPALAIKVCEEATRTHPQDAATWRYLARAYFAAMLAQRDQRQTFAPKMQNAMARASDLGDPYEMVRVASYGGFETEDETEIARRVADALERVQPRATDSADFALAAATAHGVLQSLAISAGNSDLSTRHAASMRSAVQAAVRIIGWKGVYDHYFELTMQDDCYYRELCAGYFDAVKDSQDASTFLGLGVDNLANAYRNTNRAFLLAGDRPDAQMQALEAGDRSLASVRDFASLAQRYGDADEQAAAYDLTKAARDFETYLVKAYRDADAKIGADTSQPAASDEDGWMMLALLVGGVLALSNADGGGGSPEAEAPRDWAKEQRENDCAYASTMMNFQDNMSADEKNGYQAIQMFAC